MLNTEHNMMIIKTLYLDVKYRTYKLLKPYTTKKHIDVKYRP